MAFSYFYILLSLIILVAVFLGSVKKHHAVKPAVASIIKIVAVLATLFFMTAGIIASTME